jgi:hypothetical protein
MEAAGRAGAEPGTVKARLVRHLSENASGVLYGAVLAAAATAIVSAQPAKGRYVTLSILLMLTVYSLAHLYAQVLAARMAEPGASLWRRVRVEAVHEAAVLEGGLPILFCFAVLRLSGVGVSSSAQAASWFTVALLTAVGYSIGRSLNATGLRLALEIAGAPAIGLLMIVLKRLLH